MNNEPAAMTAPTDRVNCSFEDYLAKRKAEVSDHMKNGIPDYSFPLDHELRKNLDAIPGLYSIARKVCATLASNAIRETNISSLAVGPNQFPEIYQIGCDCAKTLGIGIPQIFIVNDQSMNAAALAADDIEPFIMINSGLYERLTPGELRCVIGHECGHIHNNHTIYNMLCQVVINQGLNAGLAAGLSSTIVSVLSYSAQVALAAWSRAAEITCDRAGAICCGNIDDAVRQEVKFLYGGAFGEHSVNYEDIKKQLKMQLESLVKYTEFFNGADHPSTLRRIAAEWEFEECELLYKWRPDLLVPGKTHRTIEETNERCRKIVAVAQEGTGEYK